MTRSGTLEIVRCDGCGQWLSSRWVDCPTCALIPVRLDRGNQG